jgi:hypothetical protein
VAQYGAEAAVGRIGDAASKLPEAVRRRCRVFQVAIERYRG